MLPTVPKVRLEKEPQGRLRWFESDEERRLIAACRASALPHLADLVTVALETGMRRSEVEGLTWDRVDLSRGVLRLELTKSGRRREVPMRQRVYDVLVGRPGPREGRLWPEGSTRAGFEAAVDAAKLDAPFRFHDCRHHFARVHDARWIRARPPEDLGSRLAGDDDAVRASQPGASARGDGED